MGIAGGSGLWLAGKVADKIGQSNIGNYCLVPAIGLALFVPIQIIAFLSNSLIWSLVAFVPAIFIVSTWFAPTQATVQSIAPKHMRATASAIVLLSINLIGLGLGPLMLGLISDLLATNYSMDSSQSLRWAMIIMTSIALISAICYFMARKHASNDAEH
jgi:MFS family permease